MNDKRKIIILDNTFYAAPLKDKLECTYRCSVLLTKSLDLAMRTIEKERYDVAVMEPREIVHPELLDDLNKFLELRKHQNLPLVLLSSVPQNKLQEDYGLKSADFRTYFSKIGDLRDFYVEMGRILRQ